MRNTSGKIIFDCSLQYGLVRIGFPKVGIFDEKYSRTIWEVGGTINFKGTAVIGHGSKISVGEKGILVFGKNFLITAETAIVATKNIVFGNDCLLSWDNLIMDTDFHTITNKDGEVLNKPEDIVIGDKVWVGCRCLILKGAVIPGNSVIGANSVISTKFEEEHSLYVGIPARKLRDQILWK